MLKGTKKFLINRLSTEQNNGPDIFLADITELDATYPERITRKDIAMMDSLKRSTIQLFKNINEFNDEIEDMINRLDDPIFMSYFSMSGTSAPSEAKQRLLEEENPRKMLEIAMKHVNYGHRFYQD